nr:MAG TPA: hypothetical protein [Caudoviricetes sp.]
MSFDIHCVYCILISTFVRRCILILSNRFLHLVQKY